MFFNSNVYTARPGTKSGFGPPAVRRRKEAQCHGSWQQTSDSASESSGPRVQVRLWPGLYLPSPSLPLPLSLSLSLSLSASLSPSNSIPSNHAEPSPANRTYSRPCSILTQIGTHPPGPPIRPPRSESGCRMGYFFLKRNSP